MAASARKPALRAPRSSLARGCAPSGPGTPQRRISSSAKETYHPSRASGRAGRVGTARSSRCPRPCARARDGSGTRAADEEGPPARRAGASNPARHAPERVERRRPSTAFGAHAHGSRTRRSCDSASCAHAPSGWATLNAVAVASAPQNVQDSQAIGVSFTIFAVSNANLFEGIYMSSSAAHQKQRVPMFMAGRYLECRFNLTLIHFVTFTVERRTA